MTLTLTSSSFLSRKAKKMFGLKVKKKKVREDLVLENKGASGKAWDKFAHTHTHAHNIHKNTRTRTCAHIRTHPREN